jgi:hypothetical protein
VLRGQLAALHDCGVLDDQAHANAMQRLDAAIEAARQRAPFELRPVGIGEPAAVPVVALRRVLAVAQPLAEVDGMPLVLTSVELWTNRVDVFLAGRPTAEAQQPLRQHDAELNEWARKRREGRSEGVLSPPQLRGGRLFELDIRVRDNLDTGYRAMAGSAGGSNTEWRVHRYYEPGVSETATLLTVEIVDSATDVVAAVELPL